MVARDEDSRGDAFAAQRLEDLFLAHRSAVISYARRHAPAQIVDDVVAETFLVAWRRLDRVPADSPLPWLLAVARNRIADHRRAAGRRDALTLRLQRRRTAETIDPPAAQESSGPVADAMARLHEKDREALQLIAGDGLKPREAAAVLGISSTAFRTRLHRAKRRLRHQLEAQSRRQQAQPSAHTPQVKETRA